MPETTRAGRRTRPPRFGERRTGRGASGQGGDRQTIERRRAGRKRTVVVSLALGVAALCAAGVGFGAYAAMGDGAGPAALGGQVGIASPASPLDANGGPIAEGAPDAGDVDGVPVTESPGSGGPGTQPPATTPPGASPQPTPPAEAAPPVRDPSDPLSPEYNPYTTPGDPAFVSEAERMEWLGRQAVIRQCMSEAGFEYLEWQWWEGGTPMPAGLSADEQAAWMAALRGEALDGTQPSRAAVASEPDDEATDGEAPRSESPATEPPASEAPESTPTPTPSAEPAPGPAGGCEQVAQQSAAQAEAEGTALTAPIPARDPAAPTERERWLGFQDAVRSCMREQGYSYEYWEYWNPADQGVDGSAAMPAGLSAAQRAAWNTAAFGAPDASGAEQSLEGGGCWTTGARAVGYREFQ